MCACVSARARVYITDDAALATAARGVSLYMVYTGTVIACVIILAGLYLHYRYDDMQHHAVLPG